MGVHGEFAKKLKGAIKSVVSVRLFEPCVRCEQRARCEVCGVRVRSLSLWLVGLEENLCTRAPARVGLATADW